MRGKYSSRGSSFPLIVFLSLTLIFPTRAERRETILDPNTLKEIWETKCQISSEVTPNLRCSQEFKKVYLFDASRKTFANARNYCRQQFGALPYADLVAVESCEEFNFIQELLNDITAANPSLWTPEAGGVRQLDIWTGGYSGPVMGKKSAEGYSRIPKWLKEGSEAKIDVDHVFCKNKPLDDSSANTKILTFNLMGKEDMATELTTRYALWDDKEKTETTRFSLCEFALPFESHVPIRPTVEPTKDAATDPTTEVTTVEPLDTPTVTVTKLVTEPVTEPVTVPVTKPVAEQVTEQVTTKVTEPDDAEVYTVKTILPQEQTTTVTMRQSVTESVTVTLPVTVTQSVAATVSELVTVTVSEPEVTEATNSQTEMVSKTVAALVTEPVTEHVAIKVTEVTPVESTLPEKITTETMGQSVTNPVTEPLKVVTRMTQTITESTTEVVPTTKLSTTRADTRTESPERQPIEQTTEPTDVETLTGANIMTSTATTNETTTKQTTTFTRLPTKSPDDKYSQQGSSTTQAVDTKVTTHPTQPYTGTTTTVPQSTTSSAITPVTPDPAPKSSPPRPSSTDSTSAEPKTKPTRAPPTPVEGDCDPSHTPSDHECPEGTKGTVYKYCYKEWTRYFYNCREQWFEELENKIVKEEQAVVIGETLVERIRENRFEYGGDLIAVVEVSNKLQDLYEKQSSRMNSSYKASNAMRFTTAVVNSLSAVLKEQHSVAWKEMPASNRTDTASAILKQVQESGFDLGCKQVKGQPQVMTIDGHNINLETFIFKDENLESDFQFPSNESESFIKFTSDLRLERHPACDSYLASGIIYKEIADHLRDTEQEVDDGMVSVNSQVVAFSLSNKTKTSRLPNGTKAQITLSHKSKREFGDYYSCVYWDFDLKTWSHEGCQLIRSASNRLTSTCECNHLTNFAVLMDINGRENNDNGVKSALTLICSSVSIVALVITIVLLAFVKSLRSRRSIITTNLCCCLLLVNILVVAGLDRTKHVAMCQFISGVLLYALLASFGWMLMEGYVLYQMVILVFRSVGYFSLKWLYAFGYGVSLVIVIIVVSIIGPRGLYEEDVSYFCWISNPNHNHRIWAFAGPALAVSIINTCILVLSFKEAIKAKSRKPKTNSDNAEAKSDLQVVRRWLKGWVSLMVLVGFTWLFGLLYIHESVSWFSYIFIILNGSQARTAGFKMLAGKLPSKYMPSLSLKTTSSALTSLRTKSSTSSAYLRKSDDVLNTCDQGVDNTEFSQRV